MFCIIIDDELDENLCKERGCIWNEDDDEKPSCFLNLAQIGYHPVNASILDKTLNFVNSEFIQYNLSVINDSKRSAPKFKLIENLSIKYTPITNQIVRFQIRDRDLNRYEVPIQKDFPLLQNKKPVTKPDYEIKIGSNKQPFGFKITRLDNKQAM